MDCAGALAFHAQSSSFLLVLTISLTNVTLRCRRTVLASPTWVSVRNDGIFLNLRLASLMADIMVLLFVVVDAGSHHDSP